MRKTYWMVALATTLLAGGAGAQTIAAADIAVRSGPGGAYPITGVIAAGEAIGVGNCVQPAQWCEVVGAGLQGWIDAADLSAPASTVVQAAPVVVPSAPVVVAPAVPAQRVVTTVQPVVDGQKVEENAAVGGLGGAAMGALIAGPIGAIAGAVLGGAAGAASVEPTAEVTTYVTSTAVEPVYLEGTVAVGAAVPSTVPVYAIPADSRYSFVRINDRTVLVDPATRQIVYVYP